MRIIYAILLFLSVSIHQVQAQDSADLPKIFMIGEYESDYEALNMQHNVMLLTACDDNMEVAFDKWWSMLQEMEAYSNVIGYDLSGIKAWFNVFWEPDGSIRHIAYHLKPNSKFVKPEEMNAFLNSFSKNYTFPLVTKKKYSHYGSASFPTMPRLLGKDKTQPADPKKGKQTVNDGRVKY